MQNKKGGEHAPSLSPHQSTTGGSFDEQDPVLFMLATHQRMIAACNQLCAISDDIWLRGREHISAAVLTFLETELPLHMEDERFSLLPRLRMRLGETIIADALMTNIEERLYHDHELGRQLVNGVTGGLAAISIGSVPEYPAFFAVELIRLELHLREHIRWQESLVFPIASEHLTTDDLGNMMHEIKVRRGAGSVRENWLER